MILIHSFMGLLLTVLCKGQDVVITTTTGDIEGIVATADQPTDPASVKAYTVFKGIRYAQAPVGDLRFAKPEPVTPWEDVLPAKTFRNACVQTPPVYNPFMFTSEDCLFLNIWVPTNMSTVGGETKSTMIFFHGGSFTSGSADLYDSQFLSTIGDVIVVTINYRIGVFGFLRTRDGTNYGLWDQRAAILWVHDNIAAFGGDPGQVTLFGESAGSMSIAFHIMSPLNNDTMFQRVIMQSGGQAVDAFNSYFRRENDEEKQMSDALGCSGSADHLECLRGADASELYAASLVEEIPFWPSEDGELITNNPSELITNYVLGGADAIFNLTKNLASYDTMQGYNSQEGLLMLTWGGADIALGVQDDEKWEFLLQNMFNESAKTEYGIQIMRDMALAMYEAALPSDVRSRVDSEKRMALYTEIAGDKNLKWPTIETSLMHSAVAPGKKTYLYELEHKRSTPLAFWPEGPTWLRYGADHADELFYVFGQTFLPSAMLLGTDFSDDERELTVAMMSYWSNFAKNGDPNSESNALRGAVTWPEISENNRQYMRLTTNADVAGSDPLSGKAQFWRSAVVSSLKTNYNNEIVVSPNSSPKVRFPVILTVACAIAISIIQ